jgi:small subunit ribosomal protein S7
MPRKRVIEKRELSPDPKYHSQLVSKFVSCLMRKGKKSLAQSMLYGAFDIMKQKTKEDPLPLFQKAVSNVKPMVEVRSRRVGGSTYQVPTEVRPSRSQALSLRWIISYAKARGEKSMAAKLAGELLDASGKKTAVKKEDTHRMAEATALLIIAGK